MDASQQEQLMAYFDGELPAEEEAALERELQDDEVLRAQLTGLEHFSTLMGSGVDELNQDLDSEALWKGIAGGLAEKLQTELSAAETGLLCAPEERDTDSEMASSEMASSEMASSGEGELGTADPPSPGLRLVSDNSSAEGAKEDAGEQSGPRQPWLPLFASLAAAAALVLFFGRPGAAPTVESIDDGHLATVAPPPGTEILDVDFGHSTGAIFSIEGEAGAQYAVVWISDEKSDASATEHPGDPTDRMPEHETRVQ